MTFQNINDFMAENFKEDIFQTSNILLDSKQFIKMAALDHHKCM